MSRIEKLGVQAKVALSTASQSAGNVVVALAGLAIVRITTHRLGPTGYGTFALIVTYVTLFAMLADLGVTSITTIQLGKKGTDRSSVLSSALSFRIALSILTIPIILGSSAVIYPHETSLFRLAFATMSLDVLFSSVQVTLGAAFIARVRGDRIAVLNVLNRGLYLAGVVFVAIRKGSYFDYICAYVAADFVVALLYVVTVHASVLLRWSANLGQWWKTARIALPIGVIQIIGNIYLWIDSILVSVICSKSELGLYSLGFNVLVVVLSLPVFLMQALIPSLVNSTPKQTEQLLNRAAYVLFCVGAPIAVAGFVLRREAVLALGGPKFLAAAGPFAILFLTVPVSFLQTIFAYASVALERYRPMVPLALSALVLNVVINAFLIPRYGPSGAAVALLISECVSLIATYVVFRRITGIRTDWAKLWRPTVASLAAVPVVMFRSLLWGQVNPVVAVVLGGALVGIIYLLCLVILDGLPVELFSWRGGGAGAYE
jgi:O-antigen/teichoic acid export membrane protein